ncbi:hypothetical protein HanRHA438_Chr02g0062821 [Helianthus annuus]|nr:hypothetical protein HanRHA438_Chr02g0062821 [Helianthus annuus]
MNLVTHDDKVIFGSRAHHLIDLGARFQGDNSTYSRIWMVMIMTHDNGGKVFTCDYTKLNLIVGYHTKVQNRRLS